MDYAGAHRQRAAGAVLAGVLVVKRDAVGAATAYLNLRFRRLRSLFEGSA
jgi:hypothetical protein